MLMRSLPRAIPGNLSALPGIVGAIACIAIELLVATSNVFPSGALFGIPFRTVLYAVVASTTVQLAVFAPADMVRGPIRFGGALIGLALLATVNGLIGSTTPDDYIIDDTRTYLVTFSIPLFAVTLVRLNAVNIGQLAKSFVFGSLIYAAAKMALFALLVVVSPLAAVVLDALIANNVNGGASQVAPGISRIQTGLDFALLISIMFVLRSRTPLLPGWLRWPTLVVLGAALIITFSRALVALFVLFVLVEFFAYARGRTLVLGLAILVASGVGVAAIGGEAIQNRLETGHQGDLTRAPQAEALLDLWERHAVFGAGLGAYNTVLYRDEKAPYNYELQLHSILTKVGLVGSLALVGFAFAALLASPPLPAAGVARQIGGFLAFVAAGSTNPYLFSSAAANVYIMLFVAIGVLDDQRGGAVPASVSRANAG